METLSSIFWMVVAIVLFIGVIAAAFATVYGLATLWLRYRLRMALVFIVTFAAAVSVDSVGGGVLLLFASGALWVSAIFAGVMLVVGDVQNFGDKVSGKDRLHDHDGVWHDHPHEGWHYHPQERADSFVYTEKQAH